MAHFAIVEHRKAKTGAQTGCAGVLWKPRKPEISEISEMPGSRQSIYIVEIPETVHIKYARLFGR